MHGQVAGTSPLPPPFLLPKEPRGLWGWRVGAACSYRSASAGLQPFRLPSPVTGISNSSLPCWKTAFWRSDQAKAARAAGALRSPRAQPLHPRSCSKSKRGLWVRVASMRVHISRPSGPQTTPRGTGWTLCPHGGCLCDKSAPHSRGYSAAGGATERAYRKRRSPPHANNNLVLRLQSQGAGLPPGGRISLARRAGGQGGREAARGGRPGTRALALLST